MLICAKRLVSISLWHRLLILRTVRLVFVLFLRPKPLSGSCDVRFFDQMGYKCCTPWDAIYNLQVSVISIQLKFVQFNVIYLLLSVTIKGQIFRWTRMTETPNEHEGRYFSWISTIPARLIIIDCPCSEFTYKLIRLESLNIPLIFLSMRQDTVIYIKIKIITENFDRLIMIMVISIKLTCIYTNNNFCGYLFL